MCTGVDTFLRSPSGLTCLADLNEILFNEALTNPEPELDSAALFSGKLSFVFDSLVGLS